MTTTQAAALTDLTREQSFLLGLVNDIDARAEKATGAERIRLERASATFRVSAPLLKLSKKLGQAV
jgi:hypothetical protein